MAARRIRHLGDPILRVRCTPVQDPKSPAVRLLADDLRDTLRAYLLDLFEEEAPQTEREKRERQKG